MCPLLSALLTFLMTPLRSRLALQLEIVALRHQVAVYQRSVSRGPVSGRPTVSSGSGCHVYGPAGSRPWRLSRPAP